MYKIKTLNNISAVGLEKLPKGGFEISDTEAKPDGILVRSYDMHSMKLNDNLLAVARAGADLIRSEAPSWNFCKLPEISPLQALI